MSKSIYGEICANLEAGFLRDDFYLSDEAADMSPVRFAPGAFDGICICHMEQRTLDAEAFRQMAHALRTAAAGNFSSADTQFHAWARDYRAVNYIDDLQRYVINHAEKLDANRLHQIAMLLLLHSNYIECVKVGLALLELFGEPDDQLKEMIRRIGLYDEFTLFSVWNMQRWENGNEEIFALARKTHGWGRIHAVERLEPETEEIRYWLLTDGVKNDVEYAYSALSCWLKSDAEQTLFGQPSQEEYEAIAALIEILLDEGPTPGISALDNSEEVLLRFLGIAPEYDLAAADYNAILSVTEWAEDEDTSYPAVAEAGNAILHSAQCISAVENAVKEGRALQLAETLGVPFRDALLKCLEKDFDGHYYDCRYLLHDDKFIEPTLNLFRNKLPLSEMKGDPIDDLCMGEEYHVYDQLQFVLQELGEHPLVGTDFIKAGLESPVPRNRSRALVALQAWVQEKEEPLSELTPNLFDTVAILKTKEIFDGIMELILPLLEGQIHFDDEDECEEWEE
ncbi:hypothetical protein [Hornefia butyriciproducens]|uniref:hypothetical protein n=1 Tax=Hornefia butyriciproducens TaxID=2652293 RepID=UPI003F8AEAAD